MIEIRPLVAADWESVREIYAAGIATGNATFESEPPDWQRFDAGRLPDLRFVAADDSRVVGWVAASPVSTHPVYRGVVEHSVYVAPSTSGHGVGALLVEALLRAAAEAGYWTIQSSIFPENGASARLHERLGFRAVGRRERIALMTYGPWEGQWRDTILIEYRTPER